MFDCQYAKKNHLQIIDFLASSGKVKKNLEIL